MNFGGRELAKKLKVRIGLFLQDYSQVDKNESLEGLERVFISKKDMKKYGIRKILGSLSEGFDKPKIVQGDFTHSFIIMTGSIELKIFQWPDMPWSSDDDPVTVYGFLNLDERIKSTSSIYYKLNIINPLGIKKLDFSEISEGTH
jgi:hypothetical protein